MNKVIVSSQYSFIILEGVAHMSDAQIIKRAMTLDSGIERDAEVLRPRTVEEFNTFRRRAMRR